MTASLPKPRFDIFHRYDALTQLLTGYADALPDVVRLVSMGQSFEGRDIWVVVLTNQATGIDTDKPALWVDGNIHAAELTASTACLYFLHTLATGYGQDAAITHLLDTRTVYLCPRVNPDGAELALADRPRHIRSSTRPYPFDEPIVEGLTVEDIDGDGRVLQMRLRDPHGTYKKHSDDPRLMVAREPGEFGGEYYRLLPEGSIQDWDGLTVKLNRDREGLDLNRNFPAQWRQEGEQLGAGPYPTSEPEVRAMVDFIVQHPNIGAAVAFHTHSGVILRPSTSQRDDDMTPEDLWSIKRFSAMAEKLTGYPVVSTFHDFKYHPKETISGTQDWLYEHLGALFWVVELWSPNREAGITGYPWIEWYRDHPVTDDLKLLAWSDTACAGQAYVDWRPFEHAQLGAVELGGWDKQNFWRNPPPHLRQKEVERFPAWLQQLALSLPKLELLLAEAKALGGESVGGDTWRVRFAVANSGWLPAYVTKRALERKVVRGVVLELGLPTQEGVALVSGSPRIVGPQLEGHAPSNSQLAFLPSPALTGDRAVAEWWLRAPVGTTITLSAHAPRAGAVRTVLRLA
jgi:murein tripeptide amidase MpaA